MNDIDVISRKNAEAAQRDIPTQVAAGKFVVAEYAGLHYISHSVFDDASAAQSRATAVNAEIGQRAVVHSPASVAAIVAFAA